MKRGENDGWATTSPTMVTFGEVASNVGSGCFMTERAGYVGQPGRGAAREAEVSARRASNKRARAARRKQRGR